jgi:hypothetical protein
VDVASYGDIHAMRQAEQQRKRLNEWRKQQEREQDRLLWERRNWAGYEHSPYREHPPYRGPSVSSPSSSSPSYPRSSTSGPLRPTTSYREGPGVGFWLSIVTILVLLAWWGLTVGGLGDLLFP